MNSDQFRILVALVARGDEKPVIKQAVFYTEKLDAHLIAVHVNQPALSQPKDAVEQKLTTDIIRDRFIGYGYEHIVDDVEIIVEYGESVSKIINKYTDDVDLVILGHRKQTTFKSRIMDSIDEGILNLVSCPVLIVQKI
ncbi:MAG: universal stress protein [Candidatus Marinimicrobia bacterium]|jgi:nucleotide-binding universal stress UspA family protein|nr:universal stress protein [Candidatus Neomarinimicrobiota bacterium]